MREASRVVTPFDHMMHMLCSGMQSCMLLFLMFFCLACAGPCAWNMIKKILAIQ